MWMECRALSLDIPALHLNPRLEVEAVERKRGRYNRYSQNHILQHRQTLNQQKTYISCKKNELPLLLTIDSFLFDLS